MSRRIDQVNALLGAELGRVMVRLTPTTTVVTITEVQTSSDLAHATVWVSVLPDSDAVWNELNKQLPELQAGLAGRIELKRTPKLQLKRDQSGESVDRINTLLGKSS
ncbi:ribosome-binding factor A [Patescibacteria group bacterium]|nr:ribosome-binding factor A [Patescibacteria group bacterium]